MTTYGGCQYIFMVADRREHKEQKYIDNLTKPGPSWRLRFDHFLMVIHALYISSERGLFLFPVLSENHSPTHSKALS